MRVLCVDDALPIMEDIADMCRRLPQVEEVTGFTRPREALEWLQTHPVDLALLDIDMPEINGLMLAEQLKRRHPDAVIIFLTAFPQYAVQAIKLRATGYLLKPVTLEALEADVAHALSGKSRPLEGHVVVRTFGGFDVLVDGRAIEFKPPKCREILAFLVDRQGATVTKAELFAALWEDRAYDRGMQKQLDNNIRSLRNTLRKNGIEDILEISRGALRVRPERLVCDLYRFLEGDRDAVQSYRGEYMNVWFWASMTESLLTWRQRK